MTASIDKTARAIVVVAGDYGGNAAREQRLTPTQLAGFGGPEPAHAARIGRQHLDDLRAYLRMLGRDEISVRWEPRDPKRPKGVHVFVVTR